MRSDQGNIQANEMEQEMEQGDTEQQAPPENVASTSTRPRRRRERVPASNDDIMASIMEQDERMQAMQNNQNQMMQLMLAMQTQQQKYNERTSVGLRD